MDAAEFKHGPFMQPVHRGMVAKLLQGLQRYIFMLDVERLLWSRHLHNHCGDIMRLLFPPTQFSRHINLVHYGSSCVASH